MEPPYAVLGLANTFSPIQLAAESQEQFAFHRIISRPFNYLQDHVQTLAVCRGMVALALLSCLPSVTKGFTTQVI